MTRVTVVGNAGGGKSTMARQLSASLGLPYYEIDRIQWQPGWVATPQDEFDRQHDALLAQDKWIIDGLGPWDAMERRFEAADTIVFVDHPIWLHFWWATKRQIRSIFRGRSDGPEGCPMLPITGRLYRMMWHLHREVRPRLIEAIGRHKALRRVVHIHSPRELEAFVRELI